MKKLRYIIFLIAITMLAVTILLRSGQAEARWFIHDERMSNPVWVCQDGLYIGIGWQDHDPPPAPPPTKEVTFSAYFENEDGSPGPVVINSYTFDVPYDPLGFASIIYHKYFLHEWDAYNGLVPVGRVVNFDDYWQLEVEPCRLSDVDLRWIPIDYASVHPQRVCRDGIHLGVGYGEDDTGNPSRQVPVKVTSAGSGETLFDDSLAVPRNPYQWMAYSGYFELFWSQNHRPLATGTEVQLDGVSQTFAVDNCWLAPDTPNATTAFSYQGLLYDGEARADGAYDLELRLWDASSGGNLVAGPVEEADVSVQDGLFTLQPDFGNYAFSGGARWLEIRMRPGGSTDDYTTLSPRQEILSTPYAQSLTPGSIISGNLEETLLSVENERGNGVQILDALDGIAIDSARGSGVVIGIAEQDGVRVADAGGNGVLVRNADGDAFHASSTAEDGLEVLSSGRRGVAVQEAALYGMEITDGGIDAIRIVDAADDGIQIGTGASSPAYGLYTPPPGVNNTALLVNTANSLGEWALSTPDKIRVGTVTTNRLTQLAQVAAGTSLQVGDVVAVTGMAEAGMVGNGPLPLVQAADATHTGIIGVVETRMILQPAAGKDGENVLHSAPGPASAGEYVALTIYGIAFVRVEEGVQLSVGEQLTAADTTGRARPLRTEEINGMLVGESAPTLGIVVDTAAPGELVPVFVTMR